MLLRKMLRDMRLYKMQFISIFLMSFLGLWIFAGIGGEWMGLQQSVDRYYTDTRMADMWLYGRSFTPEDEARAAAVPGIAAAERRMTLQGTGDFGNKPELTLHVLDQNRLSVPYRVDGDGFDAGGDGIWLDSRFALARGLSPGDSISFAINGETLTRKIAGTVYGPDHVFFVRDGDLAPNFANMGYGYLPAGAWPSGAPVYNQLLLETDRTDMAQLEEELARALPGKISVFLPRKDHESVSMFQNEIHQHRAMGSLFPIVFLAIAVLTILTTMTRLVNGQRTQIGTLKALGASNSSILRHYVAYGFWISMAGSVLGAFIGPMTLPLLFYPSLQGYYTLPEWTPVYSPLFALAAVAAALLCTLTTWLACKSILAETPAQSLRPKAPRAIRQGGLEKLLLGRRAGFNTRWNLRDLVRNKIRSGMAVAGVLGCTMLLVCAFGMRDSMDDVTAWQYRELNGFRTKLTVDSAATPGEVADLLANTKGQALMEAPIEIKAGGNKKTGTAQITDQVTLLRYTDQDRRFITLPENGVSISYKMARLLQVKQGDEIVWHLYGQEKWHTSKVAAIYRTPTVQGITLSREAYEQLGGSFAPTAVLSEAEDSGSHPGASGAWSQSELADTWEEMTEAMNLMVYILIFGAVLLAVIVLYNLGLLFFTEKERELATLKVMGLQSGRIRSLLLTQNLWLSAAGILLGIPCGKWLIDSMIATMGESFDMMTVITFPSLLVSVGITLLLSVAVNLMFSGKVRRLDMVGSLKGME